MFSLEYRGVSRAAATVLFLVPTVLTLILSLVLLPRTTSCNSLPVAVKGFLAKHTSIFKSVVCDAPTNRCDAVWNCCHVSVYKKPYSVKHFVANSKTCLSSFPKMASVCEILLFLFFFDHNFGHSKLENFAKSYTTHSKNSLYLSSYRSRKSLRHDCNILIMQLLTHAFLVLNFILFLFKSAKF